MGQGSGLAHDDRQGGSTAVGRRQGPRSRLPALHWVLGSKPGLRLQ